MPREILPVVKYLTGVLEEAHIYWLHIRTKRLDEN